MTKRDFFVLMIKLFGLYSMVTLLFSGLPNNILFAFGNIDVLSIIWIVAVLSVWIGLFIILVFKAEIIVKLLRLDKGFDDDRIELGNLSPSVIIKIATFMIGGFLILNNAPRFLSQALWAFKGEIIGTTFGPQDKFNLAVSILNLLIGFLLLTNYDFVSRRLNAGNKEGEK